MARLRLRPAQDPHSTTNGSYLNKRGLRVLGDIDDNISALFK